MNTYKLSIIVPVYNAEPYIAACAKSLFEQTLEQIEFIFVDDGSTDKSVEILNNTLVAYENRMGHVQLIRHSENKGSATARNTGLLHAGGEYIGWVDSDDWVEPQMFEVLYQQAEAGKLDLVWCDFYIVDSNLQPVSMKLPEETKECLLHSLVGGSMQGMLWNKIAKRSLFADYGIDFLDGCNMGEDMNVCIKLACVVQKIKHVPKLLYYYTQYNPLALTRDFKTVRICEEINNTVDVLHFFERYGIQCFSQNTLNDFKLRTKKKLLFSSDVNNVFLWANVFPESNYRVSAHKEWHMRHKIMAWLSIHNQRSALKLLWMLKRMHNKRIF